MKNAEDELAMQEFVSKLKRAITYGENAPSNSTPGVLHIQYANDSYSRAWIKGTDGVWR
jgi:hypothetical protein